MHIAIIAIVAFLSGIMITLYPAYYCHKYIVNRNDADWQKTLEDRFDKIPTSYHEAFEKGWDACANSESTILTQYRKYFDNAA